MSLVWDIELELEVAKWLETLPPNEFAIVAFHIDRLAELGAMLRMPHSRSLGERLFELRFDYGHTTQRITFFFGSKGRRIVLLTVFRKQRMNERAEVIRARAVMERCIAEKHETSEKGEIKDDGE
jgi:hypothetical protein